MFEAYFKELKLPNLMRKTDYHQLASLVPSNMIAREVSEVLDAISELASLAKPLVDEEEA